MEQSFYTEQDLGSARNCLTVQGVKFVTVQEMSSLYREMRAVQEMSSFHWAKRDSSGNVFTLQGSAGQCELLRVYSAHYWIVWSSARHCRLYGSFLSITGQCWIVPCGQVRMELLEKYRAIRDRAIRSNTG
ncbi:hypothetical protein PoB_002568900 [Plakobranchus ocellatus]|uniref:Uncharacterized protein n=1 Tax=Plakobranchus ocellatus TaxID=259542 RepID=A0AAV3ZXR0_9GAST|nr:hypothetical protein PoB_002568900 [Plakobranchus ocellatus]